jgi:hypothetical protein
VLYGYRYLKETLGMNFPSIPHHPDPQEVAAAAAAARVQAELRQQYWAFVSEYQQKTRMVEAYLRQLVRPPVPAQCSRLVTFSWGGI